MCSIRDLSTYATTLWVDRVETATQILLMQLYTSEALPKRPLSDNPTLVDRNQAIKDKYHLGQSAISLAEEYEISFQRVYQIIKGKRK